MKHLDTSLDTSLDAARARDAADPLASFRDRFHIPVRRDGTDVTYLCGNSLGLQPKSAARFVTEELDAWRTRAVGGHMAGARPWLAYHEYAARGAASLVGADPLEVVNMNTLTVNLHLMMVSFYRPTPERHRILVERPTFPSDRYAVTSQVEFHGYDPTTSLIDVSPRDGEATIAMEDIEATLERDGESIALILLPGVNYYSGQVFDFERIARLGRSKGCVVGLDLAHGIGNIPMRLHDWDIDFAVWCAYKYLNGGPGAVAGAFVHARHADAAGRPRFHGWWGHDKASRFEMGPDFVPIRGAEGWQLSNPPILSLAPVVASLEMFEEAGMSALRQKSIALTGYLEALLAAALGDRVDVLTPADPEQRGCQLSLRVRGSRESARSAFEALESQGVVCDWREPDVIRAAPVPLYNRFEDAHRFVAILKDVSTAG